MANNIWHLTCGLWVNYGFIFSQECHAFRLFYKDLSFNWKLIEVNHSFLLYLICQWRWAKVIEGSDQLEGRYNPFIQHFHAPFCWSRPLTSSWNMGRKLLLAHQLYFNYPTLSIKQAVLAVVHQCSSEMVPTGCVTRLEKICFWEVNNVMDRR